MPGRELVEPLQGIRLVAGAQLVEPFRGFRELRKKRRGNFRADFVTAAADGGTDGRQQISGTRAKLHFHTADRFFHDALQSAAPARVYGSDGTIFWVHKENRDAVRGLNAKQKIGSSGDRRVAIASFAGQRIEIANDVGMKLFEGYERNILRSDGGLKQPAVFLNVRAAIPLGKAEIEHFVAAQRADPSLRSAETVNQPWDFVERRNLQDTNAIG